MAESAPRVLVVRPAGVDRDHDALVARGIDVVSDAYLTVEPCSDSAAASRIAATLETIADRANWLITTSRAAPQAMATIATPLLLAAAIEAGARRGLRFAAVGPAAAAALRAHGAADVHVPDQHTADGLLAELRQYPPATAVVPLGDQAGPTIPDGLRAHGWNVDSPVVYVTAPVASRPTTADRLAAGEFAVVVLRSPSAARAVRQFVPELPGGVIAVCGGPTTAAVARELGFATIVVSDAPTPGAIASAVESALAGDPTHDGSAA